MTELFKDFDFELLDDPTFREDSVREELIVPLLSAFGYSPSPPNRIIRSQRLQHPYVFIGTVKKPISIVPDYLLQREGENAWVLDAKGPNETIDSGKNVEQAYSYAMHKDVRVPVYALCNGHQLVVFHVSHWPAIINVALQPTSGTHPISRPNRVTPLAAELFARVHLNTVTWTHSRQTVQWTASGVLQSYFPVRALYGQVGERAADKIVFSVAELTGNIWMMENISE